jgi:hypothetical protein
MPAARALAEIEEYLRTEVVTELAALAETPPDDRTAVRVGTPTREPAAGGVQNWK